MKGGRCLAKGCSVKERGRRPRSIWRPSLVGWRPSLVAWRPSLVGSGAIASRLEAMATKLEAITSRLVWLPMPQHSGGQPVTGSAGSIDTCRTGGIGGCKSQGCSVAYKSVLRNWLHAQRNIYWVFGRMGVFRQSTQSLMRLARVSSTFTV